MTVKGLSEKQIKLFELACSKDEQLQASVSAWIQGYQLGMCIAKQETESQGEEK